MRSTFTTPLFETVTLTRGDESCTFQVQALPIGFQAMVQAEFAEPHLFVSGEDAGVDHAKSGKYWHRYAMIVLAKGLEMSGEIEAVRSVYPDGARGWIEFADRVDSEFATGNFTEGEISKLREVIIRLSSQAEVAGLDSGNGATLPRG